jgi:cupin fold WbuC family metalloprotein
MNLHKASEEVYIALDPIVRMGAEEVAFVKDTARRSPRKRARICAHRSNDDKLHEMLIAIAADSYIRPHRHFGKSESFHIVEGEVDVAVFDDGGALTDVIELGAPGSGRAFFYRLSESAFHTLLIRSDVLVMHEVTNGPFDPKQSSPAPFAPPEDQLAAARQYMQRVGDQVAQFRRARQR